MVSKKSIKIKRNNKNKQNNKQKKGGFFSFSKKNIDPINNHITYTTWVLYHLNHMANLHIVIILNLDSIVFSSPRKSVRVVVSSNLSDTDRALHVCCHW